MVQAKNLVARRVFVDQDIFTEFVVWLVPKPLRGSLHNYKYRFALVANNVCVLRYDNEAGKGDHKHVGETEVSYRFSTIEALLADFKSDVERWLHENNRV
ncbi:DUF6516 family protein [Phyllobacterium sp. TAF24]|uniref:toxin-antitoxin system TumE family protein n=1 Tax=Phyllobacterium sp. TAF24 TaxID=3233068 RepID=UPI003F98008A